MHYEDSCLDIKYPVDTCIPSDTADFELDCMCCESTFTVRLTVGEPVPELCTSCYEARRAVQGITKH